MKTSSTTHIVNTWLIANLIHLLLIILFAANQFSGEYIIFSVITFGLAGLVFSLPALVAVYFCFDLVAKASLPLNIRFLVWLVVCVAVVLLESIGITMTLFLGNFSSFFFFLPAIAGVLLAILCRYKAFIILASEYDTMEVI